VDLSESSFRKILQIVIWSVIDTGNDDESTNFI